jgi:hypothetical protein
MRQGRVRGDSAWTAGSSPAATSHFFRHARARPAHPRLSSVQVEDVDSRDKHGHDGILIVITGPRVCRQITGQGLTPSS